MKKRTLIFIIITGLLICFLAAGLDARMTVVRYKVSADVASPIRLALITDLHSCDYGEGEREIVEAIDAEAPDAVLLCGDIFDEDKAEDDTLTMIAELAGRYHVYYVTGNHEYKRGLKWLRAVRDEMEAMGVVRLRSSWDTVDIRGTTITFAGVDDPASLLTREVHMTEAMPEYRAQLESVSGQGGYTVLMAHRPEFIDVYAEYGFDLVVSGHAHGGQWRLPGLINGLFAPDQGLFPKYAGGEYQVGDTTMIVSRGLARETTRVPRFYNRPEVVVIEIK